MELYAPLYYKDFTCTADKCTHSCCIGWEIDIDAAALERYKGLDDPYKVEIIASISYEGSPHFTLCEDERCPHLDKDGLCKIILTAGEEYLCHICREHPRFYNTAPGRCEVGLGMACEEAARLILSSDGYDSFYCAGKTDEEECASDFDPLPFRGEIFTLLKKEGNYTQKLEGIYERFGVSPQILSDNEWQRVLFECEYLYPQHKADFSCYSSSPETQEEHKKELERALAYFVTRHCTVALSYEDFLSRLGFALFCERLLASLIARFPEVNIINHAVAVSEELEYCEENTEKILLCFDEAL
ncbi:MAG: flagellin lysine-N-methylase [Oscillospiraceae bacterium]|nr:flagellin lysine-N-methylase [Oscillospiraceae bacterium]